MIWYEDPFSFFLNISNWYNIIPSSDMTFDNQLNSLVIFAAYFCILVIIIKKDFRAVYVLAFVMLMTWIFHKHVQKEQFKMNELHKKMGIEKDVIHKDYCMKPTKDNPFMNVTLGDYREFPNRPAACADDTVLVDTLYRQDRPVDRNDVFNKKDGNRQFYTTPVTTIPNDIDSYKGFLFDLKPTLKQMHQNF